MIGFDRWYWLVAHPDTLLPLSGLAEHDYRPNLPRALELDFSGADFDKIGIHSRRELLATFNASRDRN